MASRKRNGDCNARLRMELNLTSAHYRALRRRLSVWVQHRQQSQQMMSSTCVDVRKRLKEHATRAMSILTKFKQIRALESANEHIKTSALSSDLETRQIPKHFRIHDGDESNGKPNELDVYLTKYNTAYWSVREMKQERDRALKENLALRQLVDQFQAGISVREDLFEAGPTATANTLFLVNQTLQAAPQ